jgi:tRNA threonylcarbamoyladenosine biosynthesis protein TsaE
MTKVLTLQTASDSVEHTTKLAESVGSRLRGGEVIELVSDLGGGKTAFVRGLAKGMGSLDKVASPSFTISREYRSPDLTLYHYDFYRLSDPGIVANELIEVLDGHEGVVAVEWANIVEDVLPADKLTVYIKHTGEFSREFKFSYPEKLQYLLGDNA